MSDQTNTVSFNAETPLKTPAEWALIFIEQYGQIDGGHHKAWVLDQVARILLGTPVIVIAPHMTDCATGKPSKRYLDWVNEMLGEEMDGEYEYDYDEGIAP